MYTYIDIINLVIALHSNNSINEFDIFVIFVIDKILSSLVYQERIYGCFKITINHLKHHNTLMLFS